MVERRNRRLRLAVVVVAASLGVAAAVAAAASGGLAITDTEKNEPLSLYEATKGLTGTELRDALGLEPWPTGPHTDAAEMCGERSAVNVVPLPDGSEEAYCLGPAITKDSAEQYDIASRLMGWVPSEKELLSVQREDLGNELWEAGEEERAEELWGQAEAIDEQLDESGYRDRKHEFIDEVLRQGQGLPTPELIDEIVGQGFPNS